MFEIINDISGNLTLIQLMGTPGNVNYTVIISGVVCLV